jgi:transketolase
LTNAMTAPALLAKPTLVMANTVKGKGISFMENVPKWHHGVPSEQELRLALTELRTAEARLTEASQ